MLKQNNPHSQMTTCSAREVIAALISILLVFVKNIEISEGSDGKESSAFATVSLACNNTRYPERCVSSMAAYHETHNFTNVALQVSLRRAREARDFTRSLGKNAMNEKERVAWKDCLELFRDTIHHLRFCSRKGSIRRDCPVWLSAALTNQQTCLNGFHDLNLSANSPIRALISSRAVNLSELVSNSLAMYKYAKTRNDRRLLAHVDSSGELYEDGFPEWVSARDRRLLRSSSLAGEADVLVAQDGSGHYGKIRHAIKSAPRNSRKRYIIYIKAGRYKENIVISKKTRNLMLVGAGKHKTVVTGSRSVQDGYTTFRTGTVAVSGNGFMARDMTFENTAGPAKHQAVALRLSSDQSAIYRCAIKGYQDTLYVHSLRQFYREVDIYGTVDFIFGNAAVVIQNSNIIARRPMRNQKINTITAQGRTDPNQNTGISIHNCNVLASPALGRAKWSVKTFLGRPWKEYSRTVFMQSALDDHIDPAGWLQWNGTFALSTLYYGEYMNSGPGAGTSMRVNWPGFHVIQSAREAGKFTAAEFILGNSWIPSTGIDFTPGLNGLLG